MTYIFICTCFCVAVTNSSLNCPKEPSHLSKSGQMHRLSVSFIYFLICFWSCALGSFLFVLPLTLFWWLVSYYPIQDTFGSKRLLKIQLGDEHKAAVFQFTGTYAHPIRPPVHWTSLDLFSPSLWIPFHRFYFFGLCPWVPGAHPRIAFWEKVPQKQVFAAFQSLKLSVFYQHSWLCVCLNTRF